MPEPHAFRLSGQGPTSEGYALVLDGHDITNAVTGIALHIEAQQHPVLVLHPCVFETDVESQVDVHIAEDTHDLLVRLGWTPPADA
ncbi:hypothetical protein [Nocardiopsis dassonvillei]|uniref:hypothetical protein n=1 Tax=Nocardiopsis dassonvillei TaxID=2014 RepID=UPI00363F614A